MDWTVNATVRPSGESAGSLIRAIRSIVATVNGCCPHTAHTAPRNAKSNRIWIILAALQRKYPGVHPISSGVGYAIGRLAAIPGFGYDARLFAGSPPGAGPKEPEPKENPGGCAAPARLSRRQGAHLPHGVTNDSPRPRNGPPHENAEALAVGQLRLAFFLGLDAGAEQLLEVSFFHQPVHDPVIDHFMEIEAPHYGSDLGVGLLVDHVLKRRRIHIRHPFQQVQLGVAVVDPLHVGGGLFVVNLVRFHRERLVFVEALDCLGVRFDEQFRQLGIGCDRLLAHQVGGGGVDVVEIGDVASPLVPASSNLKYAGGVSRVASTRPLASAAARPLASAPTATHSMSRGPIPKFRSSATL